MFNNFIDLLSSTQCYVRGSVNLLPRLLWFPAWVVLGPCDMIWTLLDENSSLCHCSVITIFQANQTRCGMLLSHWRQKNLFRWVCVLDDSLYVEKSTSINGNDEASCIVPIAAKPGSEVWGQWPSEPAPLLFFSSTILTVKLQGQI